jgi:protein gp37
VTLHPDRLDEPLRWRKPRRIFVCSMSDLFHPHVPDEFIDQVFAVMALSAQHTFVVLTKRPERMASYLSSSAQTFPDAERRDDIAAIAFDLFSSRPGRNRGELQFCDSDLLIQPDRWPLPNVIAMTSIEDQPTADARLPWLLRCQAAVRGVSYEPALAPVDFTRIDYTKRLLEELTAFVRSRGRDPEKELVGYESGVAWINSLSGEWCDGEDYGKEKERLGWVIAGGESGPKARPAHPDWFRSVRDQCQAAGVPFFFKQWGEWAVPNAMVSEMEFVPKFKTGREHAFDDGPIAQRVGKRAAGRLLDGVEHNACPGGSTP